MRTFSFMAGLAVLLAAAPVAAQDCDTDNDYMEVVRQQAIAGGELLAAEGFTLVDVLCGSLPEDGVQRYDTSIGENREIFYVAVCDQDCSDIDLALINSKGTTIASDVEPDDVPIVSYGPGPGQDGLVIELTMYTCSEEPCYFAVAMFSRAGTELPVPGETPRGTEPN